MISPLARRLVSHHAKAVASRSVLKVINPSSVARRAVPSIAFPSHQFASIPFQSARMSSSNPANKNFTREHLFDCKDRIALVTGGGSGIGLMITQTLVANGAKVYITGRTKEKLERVVEKYSEGKDSIVAVPCDVTSKEGIARLASDIEAREPNGVHILVNNAGISGSTLETSAGSGAAAKENLFAPATSSFDDWTDVYRTNVAQLFFATTAFLPLLQKATDASPGWSSTVVNVTSISGLVKTSQHHFQYNASKAAANHLTRMLAAELAIENRIRVRINAIAPGVFPSEMTADESGEDQKSALPKEKYEEKIPAGRPGRDQDMAQAVLALVCNQYVNAEVLVVDGAYAAAIGQ